MEKLSASTVVAASMDALIIAGAFGAYAVHALSGEQLAAVIMWIAGARAMAVAKGAGGGGEGPTLPPSGVIVLLIALGSLMQRYHRGS
jgi:hypothetical protein